jgi:hypothetical protein
VKSLSLCCGQILECTGIVVVSSNNSLKTFFKNCNKFLCVKESRRGMPSFKFYVDLWVILIVCCAIVINKILVCVHSIC